MSRRIRRAAGPATALLLIGLWAVTLRPQSLGGPVMYLVIRGDSMEPTYHAGDLVIVRAAERYAIGDIVAYRVPAGDIGAGHVLVHRIVGGDADAGYLMEGDNNRSVDPWTPVPADMVGRAWILLPGLGQLIATIHEPAILAALAVALLAWAAIQFGWFERGWSTRRKPGVVAATGGRGQHLGRSSHSPFVPPPTGPTDS